MPGRKNIPERASACPKYSLDFIASVYDKLEEHNDPELERQGNDDAKKSTKAAVLFGQAIKQDPNNRQAHYNRGIALNQIRKYSDAITCFDEALRLDPENVPALNNKAIAMAELGDTDGAKLCYADAIKFDGRYAPAHFNLGVLLDRIGEHEKAESRASNQTRFKKIF